jgi:oligoendopeptidase F
MPHSNAANSNHVSDLGELPEWDLTHLYPSMDSAEFKTDMVRLAQQARNFQSSYKDKLSRLVSSPEDLADAIKQFEAIQDLLGKLYSYAGLVYSGDTSDPLRSKFYGDVQEKLTDVSANLLFFTLEINRIDDAVLDKAMETETLAYYRPWIEEVRKEKPHQLDDKLEQLFHEKSVTGRGAWNRLFDETMSALRFEVDGELLPLEPTLTLMQDPNEAQRKKGADALAKTFSENIRTFSLITNVLAKDKDISDRWRGFEDIADSRHLSNSVERDVVDAMVEAVRASYPRLSHRYYAMKAKWFGKEALDYWDRNAPLPDQPDRKISWHEARDMVLTAYAGFDQEMANIAGRFFDENWIDAPTRPGKAPGAFAHPTVPSAHPYVLLNYQGRSRDVMTLAHELGHGVHQVLAGPQGALMAPTPLTLAETASVFGEMLTFQKLLNEAQDPKERKALLAGKVEDMINTVIRQIAFYTYERKVHTARKEGELTSDQICDIWMSVQTESLGPAIRLHKGYETFWSYVPHFIHSPFYVYAYAFGDCLVNSLYAVYQKSDAGFVDKYYAMLKAGGSKHHSELLAPFGLDASKPEFWTIGLNMIDRMITELESM